MTREEALIQLRLGPGINEDVSEEYNEAVDMAIEVLEQQPNEDCISRKAVLDSLHSCFAEGFNEDRWWNSTHVLDAINEVPSIQPQPKEEPQQKTGHWIGHREHCEKLGVIPSGLGVYEWCSNCGHGIDIRDWSRISHSYCPNCGAKMQEVQQ